MSPPAWWGHREEQLFGSTHTHLRLLTDATESVLDVKVRFGLKEVKVTAASIDQPHFQQIDVKFK